MNEQEKELKRIVDLLESRLGDSDNYLPEEPMTPSEFEEEYPVEAAMQIAVKLMLEARSSPTQGADARPVALSRTVETWRKCDPKAMSTMSEAAIFFAFKDLLHDVIALATRPEYI